MTIKINELMSSKTAKEIGKKRDPKQQKRQNPRSKISLAMEEGEKHSTD